MNEPQWKEISGYEGCYAISDDGQVKSLRRNRLLSLTIDKDGYLKAHLSVKGNAKRYSVHRLVANAFLPNPLDLRQVNHRNENKSDNRMGNLEWITGDDNLKQAYRSRLDRGSLSRATIRDIYLDFHNKSMSINQLKRCYDLGSQCITGIVQGRAWSEVTLPLAPLLVLPSPIVPFDTEQWNDVVGYGGLYRISSAGRVYSVRNQCYLRPALPNPNGRLVVTLQIKGRRDSVFIHRLVAVHFIPNPNGFPIVHHRDHDPLNNRVDNLQWCNQSHNTREAFAAGRISRLTGESNPRSRLTSSDVREIRNLYEIGNHSRAALARRFDVCADTVRRIVKGRMRTEG